MPRLPRILTVVVADLVKYEIDTTHDISEIKPEVWEAMLVQYAPLFKCDPKSYNDRAA